MAYTVLARRYRSNTFDEVVGQNHIAQTLKKAIQSERIAHAYLFCGTRGTGKTSTARILAKCLNCQSADHAVTEPCNKCDSCKSIAKGDDIDVIEIDAASNTGVDNVRDIIIGTAYNMPARSRFKIFIIDEVHMLSKQAFNALLKTLEEPPSHVKFILATTEPEKVLPTILSRCQRYDFRNIPTREIAGHLKSICKTEQIEADEDALLLVAKAGAGSMRDSLSLLDRLLSIGETRLTVELLEQLLGLPKSQLIFDLVGAVGAGDVASALSQSDAIIANGLAVDTLIVSLIDHLRNLMILRTCGAKSQLVEVPGLSPVELMKQAEMFDAGALSQDIVILEELRRHVRQSQAGRALLDATLVRMTLADQFSSLSDLVEQATVGATGAAGGQKKKSEVAASAGGGSGFRTTSNTVEVKSSVQSSVLDVGRSMFAPAKAAATSDVSRQPNSEHPTVNIEQSTLKDGGEAVEPLTSPIDDEDDGLPAPGKVWDGPRESLGALMAKQNAAMKAQQSRTESTGPEAPSAAPVLAGDLSEKWIETIAVLAKQGPALPGLLQQGQFIGIEDGRAVIRYAPQHDTIVKLLERQGKKDQIRDALSAVLNQPVGIKFELSSAPAPVQTGSVRAGSSAPQAAPQAAPPQTTKPVAQPANNPLPAAGRAPASTPPPPPMAADNANVIRLTDEIRSNLYKSEPLVKAVIDQLGGNIIKLEGE